MADHTTKPGRSYRTANDNSGREPDEDPLVELARIVSEDGSFFKNPPAKPVIPAESGTVPDSFSADLEAELTEQFQASFVRQVASAAGAADVAGAGMPAPEVYSVSEHAGYTESDSRALGAIAAGLEAQFEEVIATDPEPAGVYETAATDDRFPLFGSAGEAENDLPADPLSDPLPDYQDYPAIEPAVAPIQDPYHAAPDEAMAGTAAGEPRPNSFELEFAEAFANTASPMLTEDFTPEFGAEAYAQNPEIQDNQASPDGYGADESDYPALQYGSAAVDDGADDPYGSAMAMPPPVPARSGGRKGLIAVTGVLAVVVLVGGVAAYVSQIAPNDPAVPAPVIRAETGSVKVMADANDTAGTTPSVLDRLAGQQGKSEEKLIDRIEEPQQIARVVLPGPDGENTTRLAKPVGEQGEEPSGSVTDAIGKTIDRVMQEPQQPAADSRYDPIGPRKVRTVVVKPDGTIVSDDDVASAPSRPALPARSSPPPSEAIEVASVNSTPSPKPTPVKTMDIASVAAPGETVGISGSGNAADGRGPALQRTQVANTRELAVDAGGTTQAMAAPRETYPRPKPANAPDTVVARAPARQAVRATSQPVNLLAAPAETDLPRVTASTAPTSIAPAAGGYVVQVSSQRSADQAQATFDSMQRRYNSILGGFEPDIQRADLGEKGTYYRVRIGPMANREAALQLCEQLKSAGGNCFVTR